jgi:hypothetical protein
MPVLHRYRNGKGSYVLAHVKGRVVTFQLAATGESKLRDVGVNEHEPFPLMLLVPLLRSGEAYTGGQGAEAPARGGIEQFELPLALEAETESLIPVCAETGVMHDLHLVVTRDAAGDTVRLLGAEARWKVREPVMLSMPVGLLSLEMLAQLEAARKLPPHSQAVRAVRRWLQADASPEWEKFRRSHATGGAGPAKPSGNAPAAGAAPRVPTTAGWLL